MCAGFILVLLFLRRRYKEVVVEGEPFQKNGHCQGKLIVFRFNSYSSHFFLQAKDIVHFLRIASGTRQPFSRFPVYSLVVKACRESL